MRILFFTYEYPPLGGGIATATSNIFRVIAKNHPEVHIDCVTASLKNRWESKKIFKNVTLHFVPVGKDISGVSVKDQGSILKNQSPVNMLLYIVFATCKGVQLVWARGCVRNTQANQKKQTNTTTQNKYSVSHAFGYPGPFSSFVLRLFGLPYIVSLRGVDVPGYNKKFGWWYRLYTPLVRCMWNRSQLVIANSFVLQRLAGKIYTKPITVIPNGIDTQAFAPVASEKKFSKFTVTGGGTLMNSKKRVDLLVKGFAKFVQEKALSPDKVELLLIGDGPERKNIELLVKELCIHEYVRFVGEKPSTWLQKNLPKCHVFCLLSGAESNSNAALEAAACGLPLVLAKGIGNLEFMEKGSALVISGNNSGITVNEVADSIMQLYTQKSLAQKQARLAREYAKKYSWEKVGKIHLIDSKK